MTKTMSVLLIAGIALLALAGCQAPAALGPEAGGPAAPTAAPAAAPAEETTEETTAAPTAVAAPAEAAPIGQEETVQRPEQFAAQDLAQRLAIPVEEVTVVEVAEVEWPDASVGCPQPGMMYAQVITPGQLITLQAGGQTYSYHSGRGGQPFLCENPAAQGVQKAAPFDPSLTPPATGGN